MFYDLRITQSLDLEPRYFGCNLRATLREKLTEKVEGTCSGKHGYIVCVSNVDEISQGKIRRDGSGFATFKVTFSCLAFRPFKGEVLDCTVQSVNKMGFFAEAGPLQIFVSSHLIPEDFEYDSSGDPVYVSSDRSSRIEEGAEVRIRVVGVRIDASEMFCIGTMKEDYLGIISAT